MRVHAIFGIITTISILLVVFSGRWIADTPAIAVVLLVFAVLYVAFLATFAYSAYSGKGSISDFLLHIAISSVQTVTSCAAFYISYGLNGTGCVTDPAEAFYFSTVSFSTLGFGDLTPEEGLSRAVAAGEAVVGNLHLALFAASAFFLLSGTGQNGDGSVHEADPVEEEDIETLLLACQRRVSRLQAELDRLRQRSEELQKEIDDELSREQQPAAEQPEKPPG